MLWTVLMLGWTRSPVVIRVGVSLVFIAPVEPQPLPRIPLEGGEQSGPSWLNADGLPGCSDLSPKCEVEGLELILIGMGQKLPYKWPQRSRAGEALPMDSGPVHPAW